jgi:hypothetical protein
MHDIPKTEDGNILESWMFLVSEISMIFDPSGVFAFSQGATLAALVSLLSEQPPWKFAILVSGFDPLDEAVLGRLPKDPCPIPAMHVIGAADSFVPRARTEALASRFVSPQIYDHEVCVPSCLSKATVSFCYVSVDVSPTHHRQGGHGIPSNAQFRSAVKDFVDLHRDGAK